MLRAQKQSQNGTVRYQQSTPMPEITQKHSALIACNHKHPHNVMHLYSFDDTLDTESVLNLYADVKEHKHIVV